MIHATLVITTLPQQIQAAIDQGADVKPTLRAPLKYYVHEQLDDEELFDPEDGE